MSQIRFDAANAVLKPNVPVRFKLLRELMPSLMLQQGDDYAENLEQAGWVATEFESLDIEQVALKAELLLLIVPEDERELSNLLAISICKDVLKLIARSTGDAETTL